MFRVHNTIKAATQDIQDIRYIHSKGEKCGSNTGYFMPSVIFPVGIQILSVTFINKKEAFPKEIQLYTLKETTGDELIPNKVETYKLTHPPKTLVSHHIYPQPFYVPPMEPFYYAIDGTIAGDSSITVSYVHV